MPLIARGEPWQIVDVAVEPSTDNPGMILQLSALVSGGDARHTRHAQLLGKVHAGAAIEPLLTFWLVLLAWPAVSAKQRWVRILMGAPVFILTDAATTIVSLMHALPWAQNTLAGLPDVPTLRNQRQRRVADDRGRRAAARNAARAPRPCRGSLACRRRGTGL